MDLFEVPKAAAFDPGRVAFGRHESFALRYGWLPKGFQALQRDPQAFESEDATVTLGVGKNMVNAIRYWLQATRMAERTSQGIQPTALGLAIFDEDGWDPYLEDEATIWVIHWQLSTNPQLATAWYWFFNRFHKPEFTSQEVSTALVDFSKENSKTRTAATTVKGDAAVLLRMYVQSTGTTRTPLEEALDSPLASLRLVMRMADKKSYQSRPEARNGLPPAVVGFAVTELLNARGAREMPLRDLMYGPDGWPALGSVFRLTETDLLTKLEKLLHYLPGVYELRETAGIHQVYKIGSMEPIDYLQKHYTGAGHEAAA